MRLLLDEMWSPTLAAQLRDRGHDVAAVAERTGLRQSPDDVVLAVARTEGRAIVTENVSDFRVLAAEVLSRGETHAGLILTSDRSFPRHDRRTAGRLVLALDRLLTEDPPIEGSERWL